MIVPASAPPPHQLLPVHPAVPQAQARDHEFVRSRVIEPIGQAWHWVGVKVKLSSLSRSRRAIKPLSSAEAVELGAEIVGEVFVFSVAAGILVFDYRQSSIAAAAKEEKEQQRRTQLADDIASMKASILLLTDELTQTKEQLAALQASRNSWFSKKTPAETPASKPKTD
eukprot:m.124997 g.124997  ORF g.124997 m.124997 type:complete len:169 (+) comp9684_c0_seq3:2-508(+)